jgi:hypothetical protein
MPCFFEWDRSVARIQRTLFDGPGAELAAIGTGVLPLGRLGALGRRLLAEQASHLATSVMSALLDSGEIDPCSGLVDCEEFILNHPEKSLKTGILGRIGRRAAKHDDPP